MAELNVGTPFQEGTRALASEVNTKFGAVESFVNTEVVHSDGSNQGVFGAALVPTGAIVPFAGSNAPTGWLVCNGQEVSKSTFGALWGTIGAVYGSASTTELFRVPDLRGRVVVATDGGAGRLSAAGQLGASGGAATHTLTQAQMPSHNHTVSAHTHSINHGHSGSSGSAGSHHHGIRYAAGGGSGLNNIGLGLVGSLNTTYPFANVMVNAGAHTHSISVGNHSGSSGSAGGGNTGARGSGQAHNIVQPYIAMNFLIKT